MSNELLSNLSDDVEEDSADVNFDRNLPVLHQYLGDDLHNVSGCTYYEPGTQFEAPAFYRSSVILVPGQRLPLISHMDPEKNLLKKVHNGKSVLVFLPGYMDAMTDDEDQLRRCVGTTADLIAIRLPGADDSSSAINAIFMGRQRIRITDVWSERRYQLMCRGTILPESWTSPLGAGVIPRSWARFGNDPRQILQRNLLEQSSSESSK